MRWSWVGAAFSVLSLFTAIGLVFGPGEQVAVASGASPWAEKVNDARRAPAAIHGEPALSGRQGLTQAEDRERGDIGRDETEPASDYDFLHNFPGPGKSIFGVNTLTGGSEEVAVFADAATVHPNLLLVPVGWGRDPWHEWLVANVTQRGMMPMLSWEPWEPAGGDRGVREHQPRFALSTILVGDHDEYIDEWAHGLAEWGHPVMMRFAHEMNGTWYPWAEGRNGNREGEYRAAWRYVHDRFAAAGAVNVQWVWSPNITFAGAPPLERFYPGDDYVDLLGVVGYFGHLRAEPTSYPSFEDLFGATLAELRALSDKSIVITETGATEWGGFKPAWIDGFFDGLERHPEVIGFIWFEIDKETDWRIVSSPAATAAFAARISADPRYDLSVPPTPGVALNR